jgi:hypothetical protein
MSNFILKVDDKDFQKDNLQELLVMYEMKIIHYL